jgi:hypothetical protein
MKKKDLSGKDLLLALLYCPGVTGESNEEIMGRTRITKMIYLFEKEIYKNDFFNDLEITIPKFEAYHYGPFSRELFDDLSFFISIGLIETTETSIPISPAEQSESMLNADDSIDDEWEAATFDVQTGPAVELKYSLSPNGIKYVQENVWNSFSSQQQDNLSAFKKKINSISLDSLLNYVYNKYPEDTVNSRIADKYLKED